MNEINLFPDDYIIKSKRKPQKILMISLAVAMVALLTFLSMNVMNRHKQLKTAIAHFNEEYS